MNEEHEIISRKRAKDLGLIRYYTGKPCKNGHYSERYTNSCQCIQCLKDWAESDNGRNWMKDHNKERRKDERYLAYENKRRSLEKYKIAKNEYNKTDKMKQWRRAYHKDKRKNDIVFSIKKRIRTLIRSKIMSFGYTKKSSVNEILGCDWEYFVYHIEKQFKKGMNWDNRDQWHLDHIVPLSTAQTEDEVIALNHCTNIRPEWAKDNLSKGGKRFHLI